MFQKSPVSQNKIKKQLALIEKNITAELVKNPDSKELTSKYAAILLAQNKITEAIPAYQAAIMANPSNAKLFAGLSVAYLHKANYKMAKAMADEALKLKPEMKQAAKINAYIDQKEKVLALAKQAKMADTAIKPQDAMHGVKSTVEAKKKIDDKK